VKRSATCEELLDVVSKNVTIDSLKKSNDDSRKVKFTKSLLPLFGNNPIPFKMIENKDFEKTDLVNGISLPFKSHTTLSNNFEREVLLLRLKSKTFCYRIKSFSVHLHTDLWQSSSKKHFISLIRIFADKAFAYREVLLSFCEFGPQHTGQNIARAIFYYS
jgi:hypothetical protein